VLLLANHVAGCAAAMTLLRWLLSLVCCVVLININAAHAHSPADSTTILRGDVNTPPQSVVFTATGGDAHNHHGAWLITHDNADPTCLAVVEMKVAAIPLFPSEWDRGYPDDDVFKVFDDAASFVSSNYTTTGGAVGGALARVFFFTTPYPGFTVRSAHATILVMIDVGFEVFLPGISVTYSFTINYKCLPFTPPPQCTFIGALTQPALAPTMRITPDYAHAATKSVFNTTFESVIRRRDVVDVDVRGGEYGKDCGII
jgi:hypothetical protein